MYRSLNNRDQQYLGCTPGKKTDTSCVTKAAPPPSQGCVNSSLAETACVDRRLSVSENDATVEPLERPSRRLDLVGTCSCDGHWQFRVIFLHDENDNNCVYQTQCDNLCPGASWTCEEWQSLAQAECEAGTGNI